MKIPIEVSARHIHLSQSDLEKLFGLNYKLKKIKNLSQPGEFACEEKVLLRNGINEITARVIGPTRNTTQIEISEKDADKLKMNPPRRMSGDLKGSLGVKIIGPKGEFSLKKGLILSQRHIHLDKDSAKELNLKDGQKYDVQVLDAQKYIFNDILVRVSDKYIPALHIDAGEAETAGIKKGEKAEGIILQ